MTYKQSIIGKFDADELRDIYESLSKDAKAMVDAKAERIPAEMRRRGQAFSRDMALELIFKTAARTQNLDLLV